MDRRTFLRHGALASAVSVAGCLDRFETRSVWSGAPLVENRPDAVYVPASTEGMGSYGTRTLDDGSELSLHYTFPHRFWLVTGERRERVRVSEGDSIHLMASVWDPGTGIVLPRQPRATVLDGESTVASIQVWPMIAQRMGYHFGNNVSIPEDGEYTVRIHLDPVAVRTAGGFAGRYEEPVSIDLDVTFDAADVTGLEVNEMPSDRRGTRGAVSPMEMGPPPGRVPATDERPGTSLGSGRSSDAVLAGTLLDSPPAGIDGDGPYLAVSAHTPYNRIVLPMCSLAVDAGGVERDLVETVDDRLGHHYGGVLPERPTEESTIRVDASPQVSRHDGYETAFFDVEPVTLSAP